MFQRSPGHTSSQAPLIGKILKFVSDGADSYTVTWAEPARQVMDRIEETASGDVARIAEVTALRERQSRDEGTMCRVTACRHAEFITRHARLRAAADTSGRDLRVRTGHPEIGPSPAPSRFHGSSSERRDDCHR